MVIDHYLKDKTIQTDQEVYEFISALGAPILGTRVNCREEGHTSPFRAVSDIITGRALNYIVWANRGGSKTYAVGGFPTWYRCIRNPRLQTLILGGSESQSTLSYQAMEDFFRMTGTENEYLEAPGLMKTKARFSNGSEVSILAASTKSVRGPHPQILLLDEVDEMDEEVYSSALSQPQSRYGIPASLGIFSTNHRISGLMDVAVAKWRENNRPVYQYCIWECLESCRDYNCSTCPLSSWCPGIHMKQANGYYKIKDFADKLEQLSVGTLERDWFCIKRGRGDLVYQDEYDPDRNDVAVQLRQAPVTLSIDFGGADPFSLGVWQAPHPDDKRFPPDSMIRVTELYLTSVDRSLHNGIVIKEAKTKPWWKLIQDVVPDSARPDLIAEWREALPNADFHVMEKREIDEGIEMVKNVLAPAEGPPKLYINRICRDWKREVGMYCVKKLSELDYKVVDRNNHAMDETRYFVQWKFKHNSNVFVGVASHDQLPE